MKKLNLLNNLIEITGQQDETIHQFIDLNKPNHYLFFETMNKRIVLNGYLSKDELLKEALKYNISLNI